VSTIDACWWVHVSNAEVLQQSGLSTIGDILRHRHLSLFGHVACLDPGVLAHDALRMVDWIPTKAERPAGEDRRVTLSTSDSTRFRRIPTIYCYLRCVDLRSSWVTERHSSHLEYTTTMMVMMMMMKACVKNGG